MDILQIIRQVDWKTDDNKKIAENLISNAFEYMRRVEAHIYKGNEIRSDMFMDHAEKQEELSKLDRKRTEAHDRMLTSFKPFLDLLMDVPGFMECEYNFSNRTRIADFIALIAFEIMGSEPSSRKEGEIRDELAEKLHFNEITFEQIYTKIQMLASE